MICYLINLADEILEYIFNYLNLNYLFELKKCNILLDYKINKYINYLSQKILNENIFFNKKYRYYNDILYLNYFLLPFDNNNLFPIHRYFCQNKHFLSIELKLFEIKKSKLLTENI